MYTGGLAGIKNENCRLCHQVAVGESTTCEEVTKQKKHLCSQCKSNTQGTLRAVLVDGLCWSFHAWPWLEPDPLSLKSAILSCRLHCNRKEECLTSDPTRSSMSKDWILESIHRNEPLHRNVQLHLPTKASYLQGWSSKWLFLFFLNRQRLVPIYLAIW